MTGQGRDSERWCSRCGHPLSQHHHHRPVDCSGCNAGGEHCDGPTPPAPSPVEGETALVKRLRRMASALRNGADYVDNPGEQHMYADLAIRAADVLAASSAVGETRVEWGVRWANGRVTMVGPSNEHSTKKAEIDSRCELVRRTITTYPDGSFLTSPWVPVTDKETDQ